MVIGGVALLFLFLYRRVVFPSRYSSNAAVLKRLTLDPRLDKGAVKARALMSHSNPYGYIVRRFQPPSVVDVRMLMLPEQNLIDPYAGGIFNPSLIALPDNVYLGARILMVARGTERFEVITGEDVRWQTIHGLFVIPMERKHLGLPYLARESDLFSLNLPARREVPFNRCEDRFKDQVRPFPVEACEAAP